MKRSELAVDLEVYYSSRTDWETPGYGTGYGFKATIKAVEPYSDKYPVWSRVYHPYKVDKGTGVLVEVHRGESKPETKVVPLGHLRGAYAEIMSQLEEYAERRDERETRVKQARATRERQAEALAGIFKGLGYPHTLYPVNDSFEMKVPMLLLAQMAEALHEAGWTYSK